MNTLRVSHIIATCLLIAEVCIAPGLAEARLIVRVVDESAQPITNAQVTASFDQYVQRDGQTKSDHKQSSSDTNGFVIVTGMTRGRIFRNGHNSR